MNLADVIEAMSLAGATPKLIAEVSLSLSKSEEFRLKEKRAVAADRQRVYRLSRGHMLQLNNNRQCIDQVGDSQLKLSRGVTTTPSDTCNSLILPTGSRDARARGYSLTSLDSKKVSKKYIYPKSPEFDDFYAKYPKRINRKAALGKFEVAVKSGVEPEKIIAAAVRYAELCRSSKTEPQFIKAPDVWLNKGCYDDELPFANGHDPPADTRTPEQKRDDWIRIQNELDARDNH